MEIATIEKKSLWPQTTNFVDLENPVKPGNSIKIKKLKKKRENSGKTKALKTSLKHLSKMQQQHTRY